MSPIGKFALKVGFWLPICYAVWYFSSTLSVIPLASALDMLLSWHFPTLIGGIEPEGNHLLVKTPLIATDPDAASTMYSRIRFETHPLYYGYSLPLFTALLLASPGGARRKVILWLVGMAILLLVQFFGVATGITKILVFDLAAYKQLEFSATDYRLLALAFKFGYLILPPVAPILIWLVQFRSFLFDLTGIESAGEFSKWP